MGNFPFWIAHRGLRSQYPENTLLAFQQAYNAGFRAFETDCKLTRDNEIWLFHDDELDMLTNMSGRARDYDWQQLQQCTILNGGIPCLLSALWQWMPADSFCNLEIKPCPGREWESGVALGQFCQKYPKNPQNIVISSFSEEALCGFNSIKHDYPIAMLFEAIPENYKDIISNVRASTIHCDDDFFDEKLASVLIKHYPLRVYTVNNGERAEYLRQCAVSGIFTDNNLVS